MFVEGKITCMATLVALTDMQLVRLAYIEEYYQLGLFNDRKSIIKTSFRVLMKGLIGYVKYRSGSRA